MQWWSFRKKDIPRVKYYFNRIGGCGAFVTVLASIDLYGVNGVWPRIVSYPLAGAAVGTIGVCFSVYVFFTLDAQFANTQASLGGGGTGVAGGPGPSGAQRRYGDPRLPISPLWAVCTAHLIINVVSPLLVGITNKQACLAVANLWDMGVTIVHLSGSWYCYFAIRRLVQRYLWGVHYRFIQQQQNQNTSLVQSTNQPPPPQPPPQPASPLALPPAPTAVQALEVTTIPMPGAGAGVGAGRAVDQVAVEKSLRHLLLFLIGFTGLGVPVVLVWIWQAADWIANDPPPEVVASDNPKVSDSLMILPLYLGYALILWSSWIAISKRDSLPDAPLPPSNQVTAAGPGVGGVGGENNSANGNGNKPHGDVPMFMTNPLDELGIGKFAAVPNRALAAAAGGGSRSVVTGGGGTGTGRSGKTISTAAFAAVREPPANNRAPTAAQFHRLYVGLPPADARDTEQHRIRELGILNPSGKTGDGISRGGGGGGGVGSAGPGVEHTPSAPAHRMSSLHRVDPPSQPRTLPLSVLTNHSGPVAAHGLPSPPRSGASEQLVLPGVVDYPPPLPNQHDASNGAGGGGGVPASSEPPAPISPLIDMPGSFVATHTTATATTASTAGTSASPVMNPLTSLPPIRGAQPPPTANSTS